MKKATLNKQESESSAKQYFDNLDYSVLPKEFGDYIKEEILTDTDLENLSVNEPVFLEIKAKIEKYSNAKPIVANEPANEQDSDIEETKMYLKMYQELILEQKGKDKKETQTYIDMYEELLKDQTS